MTINYGKFSVLASGRVVCRLGHEVVPGRVFDHIHAELDAPKPDPEPAPVDFAAEDDWWEKALEQSMAGLK